MKKNKRSSELSCITMSNIALLFLPLAFSSLPAVLPFVSPSSQVFMWGGKKRELDANFVKSMITSVKSMMRRGTAASFLTPVRSPFPIMGCPAALPVSGKTANTTQHLPIVLKNEKCLRL